LFRKILYKITEKELMRKTYRILGNEDYWEKRWGDIPADLPMKNHRVYPLKYAEMTIKDSQDVILEAGCGAGRILRYYHDKKYNIVGIDFIKVAIEKLKAIDNNLNVEVGNITDLQFSDQSFKYILSFGLYHNLENKNDLKKAIDETYRVLKNNGSVCASFRADNLQTKITDWLTERKDKKNYKFNDKRLFHKMNLTKKEYLNLFKEAGFKITFIEAVENMPFLYKFSIFRSYNHKKFDENMARSQGYRLSWLGQKVQNFLIRFFPDQFCNIYVLIAKKI